MKREINPTNYILLTARTRSEWDNCSFVIIHITEQWRQLIKKRSDLAKKCKCYKEFNNVNFWESPEGFFAGGEHTGDILAELENEVNNWAFICPTPKDLTNLEFPETQLHCHTIHLDAHGNAWFSAIGKYSGEEFISSLFNVTDLLESTKYLFIN